MIASALDLVAEQLDPVAELLVGRPELDHVAADAELAALERDVVAVVLDVDELQQHLVAVDDVADAGGGPSSCDSRRASRGRRCTRRWRRRPRRRG